MKRWLLILLSTLFFTPIAGAQQAEQADEPAQLRKPAPQRPAAPPKPQVKKEVGPTQQKAPVEPSIKVLLADGSRLSDPPSSMNADGHLVFKNADGEEQTLPVGSLARVDWEPRDRGQLSEKVDRVVLRDAGVIAGALEVLEDGQFELKHDFLGDLRGIISEVQRVAFAGISDRGGDVESLDRVVAGENSYDGQFEKYADGVATIQVEGESTTVEKPGLILFPRSLPTDLSEGWYVRMSLVTGERLLGLLEDWTDAGPRIVTPSVGRITVPTDKLVSMVFTPTPIFQFSRLVVCDRQGLQLMTREGEVIWKNVKYRNPIGVIRLPDGRVVVADRRVRQLVLLDNEGKEVWNQKVTSNMYSITYHPARKVIAVSEYSTGTISEYNIKGENVGTLDGPDLTLSLRVTPRGTYLCGTGRRQIIEVDAEGKELFKLDPQNVMYIGSARELSNGNYLVADMSGSRVVEFDKKGKEVWTQAGLSAPKDAIRLADGNTLILESQATRGGQGRISQVDPEGETVWELAKFVFPQAFAID